MVHSDVWSTNLEIFRNLFVNYNFECKKPREKSRGVAIYIDKEHDYTRLDLHIGYESIEDLWIILKLKNNNLLVGGVYRHPDVNINKFNRNLKAFFDGIIVNKNIKNVDRVIMLGNININLLNIHEKDTSSYLDIMARSNFASMINHQQN